MCDMASIAEEYETIPYLLITFVYQSLDGWSDDWYVDEFGPEDFLMATYDGVAASVMQGRSDPLSFDMDVVEVDREEHVDMAAIDTERVTLSPTMDSEDVAFAFDAAMSNLYGSTLSSADM